MNVFRTGFLMALLTGIFLVVGFLLGGTGGMVIAFLFAAGTNLFAYWNSDKMVLRMYGAREVDETTAPDLVHIVRRLSQADGLPMPKVLQEYKRVGLSMEEKVALKAKKPRGAKDEATPATLAPAPVTSAGQEISKEDKEKLNRLLQEIAWDTVTHHPMTGVQVK